MAKHGLTLGGDRGAEHVAGGEVAEAVIGLNLGRLRAFAAPGGANQDKSLVGFALTLQPALDLAHQRIGGDFVQGRGRHRAGGAGVAGPRDSDEARTIGC